MSAVTEKLDREISKLSGVELVSLHERLIARIHASAEAKGLDPAYQEEIRRRLTEIDDGTAKGLEAFRALKKM